MIGIIPQKQQTSFGDKSSQEKKDLEEEKKRLNNLSLALDNKNKDLEEKQKDIVNKEKDLKQREENLQSEEQDLTTRRSYIASQEQSLMLRENEITQREGELNQRETDLNNNSSSNIPDVFFLMDRLDNLPFELPMDWVHREEMNHSYLIGNENKPNLHSFLKCALPESEESDYGSIIKEEYLQKIYKLFTKCLSFFRSNMYSSEFEYIKKQKIDSYFFYYSDFLFQQPFLFMFSPAVRYRIEFLDNTKTVKCYLKFCLDLPVGQEETAPKFGFSIFQIIFNKSDTYNDFKNLLKNETFKDEYKDIIFIN